MSTTNIIRAWKDPEYRASLSEAELALMPQNPAGLVELTDADLGDVAGGKDERGEKPQKDITICWVSSRCGGSAEKPAPAPIVPGK